MIDYQRIVEFLRDFRATPGQPLTDEVRRAAAEYAQLCVQANDRLRQCSTLLQQGLRSEAIHLANETPSLLELVAALDLPEAASWGEFCQQNDLPVAPPLQMERAAQLNDAYGQEEPLEGLLRRHRRLALAHAPIKDRLDTMRQIRELDTTSAFWEKDIREFEVARMREIRVAFAAALEHHDAQAVTTLSGEILQSPWLEPVSKDLLSAAHGAEQRLHLMATDTSLRALLARLRSAFAARDHAACTSLIHEVRTLLAQTKQGVSEQTAAELNPIIAWIAQENELEHRRQAIEQARKRLAEALDTAAPEPAIEAGYEALRELGEPVPAELEGRRQQLLQQRLCAARRRSRLVMAGVAAAVILAIIGGYLYFRWDLASGWARKIHEANVARDLPLARQLIEEQERRAPQFAQHAGILQAKQETSQLQKEYDRDLQQLQGLLRSLEEQHQRFTTELEREKTLRADQLLAMARDANESARRGQAGKPLLWADAGGKLAEMVTAIENQAAQLREAADRKALAQAQALEEQLVRVSVSPAPSAMKQAEATLNAVAKELAQLRKLSGLGKEASEAVAAIAAKHDDKQAALTKGLDQSQQLAALHGRAVSSEAWQKALEAFASRFPDAPESRDFTRAISLLQGSIAIESLATLQEGWAGQFTATSESMARKRIEELQGYTNAYPRSPYLEAIRSYIQYLAQSADALAVKSSWNEGFRELTATPLMADLRYVAASDGTKYYVLGDFKPKPFGINDRLSVRFEAVDPADLTKRRTITVAAPLTLITEKPLPVPQARFIEKLNIDLKRISPDNWDTFGIQVIDQLVKDKEMDVVVRAILLQQTLKTSVQVVGWALGDLYEASLRDLARHEVENIVWYDPEKPVPQPTVEALQNITSAIPKADVALKTLRDRREKLLKSVSCSFATTGALMRDENGKWAIYPCASVEEGSSVWAAGPLPKAADQPASLVRVARYAKGVYAFDNAALSTLPEGTMVFIGK